MRLQRIRYRFCNWCSDLPNGWSHYQWQIVMDSILDFLKVIDMESDVLKALEFNLGTPTVRTFLRQESCSQPSSLFNPVWSCIGYFNYSLSCRRFNEVALEDNQVNTLIHDPSLLIMWKYRDKLRIPILADVQSASGVPGLLPSRVEYAWLQLRTVSAIFSGRFGGVSLKIHRQAECTSLGKILSCIVLFFLFSCPF